MPPLSPSASPTSGYSDLKHCSLKEAPILSYETMRRSTRIPKELAVLLTGSDMEGRGFSEMTKTVLLSRHGAGIVSTYKLYAEQEVIIRYLDTNKEAVVRVVGRIGDEGETYTYGVAFVDPNMIDFWGIDFPPVSQKEKEERRVLLACTTCGLRETVEHLDVESDVLIINDGIVRYCKECHDSTLWKRAAPAAEEEPVLVSAPVASSKFAGAASTALAAPPAAVVETPAVIPSGFDSVEEPPASAAASSPVASPAAPAKLEKPENRRKHTRTRVSYKACIRRSSLDEEVVTCEDMSRGGICFKSRKRYYPNADVDVAVPFAPGGNAIFVPARIVWCVEITPDRQYKCGLAYRTTSRPA